MLLPAANADTLLHSLCCAWPQVLHLPIARLFYWLTLWLRSAPAAEGPLHLDRLWAV